MGLLGYAAKKAIQTAATKSVIKTVANAAVETIDAVGEAKAKAAGSQNRGTSTSKYEWPNENEPVISRAQIVTQTVLPPTNTVVAMESTCAKCGATLRVSSDRTEFFCEYCGAKNFMNHPSYSVTHTEIDQARIREAESKEAIRIKELEVELERIKAQREVEVAKASGKKQHWFVALLKFLFKIAMILMAITIAFWVVMLLLFFL